MKKETKLHGCNSIPPKIHLHFSSNISNAKSPHISTIFPPLDPIMQIYLIQQGSYQVTSCPGESRPASSGCCSDVTRKVAARSASFIKIHHVEDSTWYCIGHHLYSQQFSTFDHLEHASQNSSDALSGFKWPISKVCLKCVWSPTSARDRVLCFQGV